jgi:uncharacterized protein YlaI
MNTETEVDDSVVRCIVCKRLLDFDKHEMLVFVIGKDEKGKEVKGFKCRECVEKEKQ